jgi:hypothetical protein
MPWNKTIMRTIINGLREQIPEKKLNQPVPRISQEQKEYLKLKVKGKDRQINMARLINLIRALVVTAKIQGIKVRILIDSGCLNNFVFSNFVKKA